MQFRADLGWQAADLTGVQADIERLGQGALRCVTATVVALDLRPLQVSR